MALLNPANLVPRMEIAGEPFCGSKCSEERMGSRDQFKVHAPALVADMNEAILKAKLGYAFNVNCGAEIVLHRHSSASKTAELKPNERAVHLCSPLFENGTHKFTPREFTPRGERGGVAPAVSRLFAVIV